MDLQIIWTETATSDLREVVRYIVKDKPEAARKIGMTIIGKIESLIDNPYIGRKVPEKNDNLIRELILNPYRLIYQINNKMKIIYILRIWHAYRGKPQI
jgi:addiction module RelE/StbE family toxin